MPTRILSLSRGETSQPIIRKSESFQSKISLTLSLFSYRQHPDNKYPPLHLNDEEQKMAMKEGMKFPSHYPLTRLVGKIFTLLPTRTNT